jgi:hypothetical protein
MGEHVVVVGSDMCNRSRKCLIGVRLNERVIGVG